MGDKEPKFHPTVEMPNGIKIAVEKLTDKGVLMMNGLSYREYRHWYEKIYRSMPFRVTEQLIKEYKEVQYRKKHPRKYF